MKNEAQFQFKRLADFHKLFLSDNSELFELDIHSAKDKTMDVKSVETKDDQINSQTNKLRNPKVDVKTEPDVQIEPDSSADESILQLKQENTRLASALTCSVCSNMVRLLNNFISALKHIPNTRRNDFINMSLGTCRVFDLPQKIYRLINDVRT